MLWFCRNYASPTIFCPILPLIALAFANDSFIKKGYERQRVYSDSELKTPKESLRSAVEGQYFGYPSIPLR